MDNEKKQIIQEKLKTPQINPRQLLVYILVQIITVIQGIMPLLIGGAFNPIWFIIAFIMNNIAYFGIMALRSVAMGESEADPQMVNILGNFISDSLKILTNVDVNNEDRISMYERMAVWTVRQLDELYMDEFKIFTKHIRETYFNANGTVNPIDIKIPEPVAPEVPKVEPVVEPDVQE